MANSNSKKIIFYFLFCHIFIWTLVPALSNSNLPRDTIEALAWGSNLDWGFEKHPPLAHLQLRYFTKFLVNKIGHIIFLVKFLLHHPFLLFGFLQMIYLKIKNTV